MRKSIKTLEKDLKYAKEALLEAEQTLQNKKDELIDTRIKLDRVERYPDILSMFMGFILGLAIFALILHFTGTFDSPLEKLNVDEDALAKEYVLYYYPEYEGCKLDYMAAEIEKERVIVTCSTGNRDGLRLSGSETETKIIYFDKITLEEIAKRKIASQCDVERASELQGRMNVPIPKLVQEHYCGGKDE